MVPEIERKFLVTSLAFKASARASNIIQGYLPSSGSLNVRIRVEDESAFLTMKTTAVSISRDEFEYKIPLEDAYLLLHQHCSSPLIEKTRYHLMEHEQSWTIDVFHGANEGLILAEAEIGPGKEELLLPSWIGREVTGDPMYYNFYLSAHPFTERKPF